MKKWMAVLGLAVFVFLSLTAVRTYNRYRFHLEKQTRFMMNSYVTVYAVGPKKKTQPAVNAAMERMQAVDMKFSAHNPGSPVYAFNHEGLPIEDPEILEVVRLALQIARDTNGAFDITVAPLIELWGFYGDSPRLPPAEAIEDCLKKIGYRQLILEDSRLKRTNPDVRIDLGGIAQGYACRQAAKVLREQGVASALIDVSGDIYALGRKGGGLWKVGVRNPRSDNLLGYVEVEDLAVVGSGDYERYFFEDGKRYHHIFNPKTGYPVEGVSATTLLHPDPAVADAWSTALFVLGPVEGLKRVEKIAGMEGVVVNASGEVLYSSGLKDVLHAVEPVK
jgi:thiamine biosynthesis lipoprotein